MAMFRLLFDDLCGESHDLSADALLMVGAHAWTDLSQEHVALHLEEVPPRGRRILGFGWE
jgi:hypothetical protein